VSAFRPTLLPLLLRRQLYTPGQVGSLAWWLDATRGVLSAGVASVDGDPVSQWSDQSLNTRHLAQSTLALKPTFQTAEQNGLPMVQFDGVDDRMTVASFSLGTAATAIILAEMTAIADDLLLGGSNAPETYHFYTDATNVYYKAAGTGLAQVAHGASAGQTVQWGYVRDGTSFQFWKNGAKLGAVQTLAANNAADVTTLGSGDGGAFWAQAYIAEVALYARALTDAEMVGVSNYLKAKWGV
jgi:hypothetical protein